MSSEALPYIAPAAKDSETSMETQTSMNDPLLDNADIDTGLDSICYIYTF